MCVCVCDKYIPDIEIDIALVSNWYYLQCLLPGKYWYKAGWYYLKCLPSKYWYKGGIASGRSYQSSCWVFDTTASTSLYTRVQVWYKSNTGNVIVHTQSFVLFFFLFSSPLVVLGGSNFPVSQSVSAFLLNSGPAYRCCLQLAATGLQHFDGNRSDSRVQLHNLDPTVLTQQTRTTDLNYRKLGLSFLAVCV